LAVINVITIGNWLGTIGPIFVTLWKIISSRKLSVFFTVATWTT